MRYFAAGLLIGLIVNLFSDRRWYKFCDAMNEDWSSFCQKQNTEWAKFHAKELAKQKVFYEKLISGQGSEGTE